MDKWLEQTFPKKTEMANKHIKRCSTPLNFKESKQKPQWDINSYPLEIASVGENVVKLEHLHTLGKNV